MITIGPLYLEEDAEKDSFLYLMEKCLTPKTREWLEWKYLKNPLNMDGKPFIFCAKYGDKIVGIRSFILTEVLLNNGASFIAGQACDTAVDPEFQGKGIFAQMNQTAIREAKNKGIKLILSFPNFKSQPGNLKMGFKIVSLFDEAFLFCDFQNLVRNKCRKRLFTTGSKLLSICLNKTKLFLKNSDLKVDHEIKEENCFNNDFEHIWKNEKRLRISRDTAYMNWRFLQRPDKRYHIMTARKNGDLEGYLISTISDRWGVNECQIVDFQGKEKDIQLKLLNTLVSKFSERVSFFSILAFTEKKLMEKLSHSGFYRRSDLCLRKFVPQRNFLAKDIDEKFDMNIYDIENWSVRSSDMDTY